MQFFLAGASGGLAHFDPIGRSVARARKSRRVDKALHQAQWPPVFGLPVLPQPTQDPA